MAKKRKSKKTPANKTPNYEIHIQEEPGRGYVQLLIEVNNDIEEKDFFVLFSLIEEYNMIISLRDIVEANYNIMKKMHLKELFYPKQGTVVCVTVIEDFDKAFIHYLKMYFKNKLIYTIGKKDKEMQKKAEAHLESIEIIISELVDNAFTYPFEKYLRNNEKLSNKLRNVSLIDKYKKVKQIDTEYQFNATIFFEAQLKSENNELIIGISNEAEINKDSLDIINNRINNDAPLPGLIEESLFTNPYKETSGLGLSMARTIVESLNGKMASFYDDVLGRFIVEFSIILDNGDQV
ncbi:MAG: hypothetical protein JW969_07495 [Spirochaetales bacterium]|nr:hypothetical protein [Spirochaetales bacterium]